MAISFVAFVASASDPAGAQAGDLLLANYATAAGSAHVGPAGWTQVGTTINDGTWQNSLWYIVRGGSAPSFVWTGGGAFNHTNIAAWRGVNPAAPINVSAQASATATSPSVTTTVDNCWLVSALWDLATIVDEPAGMTRRSGASGGTAFADEVLGAQGPTGTRAWENVSPHSVWSVALAPEAGFDPALMAAHSPSWFQPLRMLWPVMMGWQFFDPTAFIPPPVTTTARITGGMPFAIEAGPDVPALIDGGGVLEVPE